MKHLGCWKDALNRAIGIIDLTGKPIKDLCQAYTAGKGWSFFAIQNTEECLTAPHAGETYKIYGASTDCYDGLGGGWANDVYQIVCFENLGKYPSYTSW